MRDQSLYREPNDSRFENPQRIKSQQKKPKLHDIRLHTNIGANDLAIKVKQIEKFLSKKEQVRITVQLRGREKSRPQSAVDFLMEVVETLKEVSMPQKLPTVTNISVMLNPKK